MRGTSGQARSRRAHQKASVSSIVKDKDSGIFHVRHHVSPTGMYRGRMVIDIAKRELRKVKQNQKQEKAAKEEEVVEEASAEDKPLDAKSLSKS